MGVMNLGFRHNIISVHDSIRNLSLHKNNTVFSARYKIVYEKEELVSFKQIINIFPVINHITMYPKRLCLVYTVEIKNVNKSHLKKILYYNHVMILRIICTSNTLLTGMSKLSESNKVTYILEKYRFY